MNLHSCRSRILALVLMVSVSQTAWSGRLDVDITQVSPTKAFIYCLAFPGGGHYYLSKINPEYKNKFYFFLGLGIASGALMYTQTRVKNNAFLVPTFMFVGGLKLWEFGSANDGAEKERLKWMEEHFKTSGTAAPPVNASGK